MIVRYVIGSAKFPIVIRFDSEAVMMPEFCKPTVVINKPIPAVIACFKLAGIASSNM
ncbi:hypothetical protein D3C75_1359030 [compost metagenome]